MSGKKKGECMRMDLGSSAIARASFKDVSGNVEARNVAWLSSGAVVIIADDNKDPLIAHVFAATVGPGTLRVKADIEGSGTVETSAEVMVTAPNEVVGGSISLTIA
jgi:hypothetical protein